MIVAAIVFVVLFVLQRFALRDLRRLENDYIAAREPTACATQNLLPFAFPGEAPKRGERDAAVAKLVNEAAREVRTVRVKFVARGSVFPFPPLRSAHAAVRKSMDKQVVLYEAMVADPDHSDDELRASGLANTSAERKLNTVRGWLFVGSGKDWRRRFVCDKEPPFIPPP